MEFKRWQNNGNLAVPDPDSCNDLSLKKKEYFLLGYIHWSTKTLRSLPETIEIERRNYKRKEKLQVIKYTSYMLDNFHFYGLRFIKWLQWNTQFDWSIAVHAGSDNPTRKILESRDVGNKIKVKYENLTVTQIIAIEKKQTRVSPNYAKEINVLRCFSVVIL
jgi:hypothetical protein